MIVKTIKGLGRSTDAESKKLQTFKKDLENTKNNETELKNAITEMKDAIEGISSGLNDSEEWISKLEDIGVEITAM